MKMNIETKIPNPGIPKWEFPDWEFFYVIKVQYINLLQVYEEI